VACYGFNGDPLYDIEGYFQYFPLEKPYVIDTDLDVWQHEDDIIIYLFQQPMDDLLWHSLDDFWSYPGRFDTYSFENLDLFYEEEFQPWWCSNFDEGKDIIGLEKDFCDESFHPFPFSPFCSTIDMVGSFPHDSYFPVG